MRSRRTITIALLTALTPLVAPQVVGGPLSASAQEAAPPRVLVWGGTYGFRHPSITDGELAFLQMAQQTGAFDVTVTENPADLRMDVLRQYDVLAWISTTGKAPMTEQQRADVIRWSECGGGNLGFHAVLDSEYGWAEHAELFGAQFDSHPKNAGSGAARMLVEDGEHPITEGWAGDSFMLDDEYYRWRSAKNVPGISLPRNDAATDVLLSLDETTVGGGIQEGPLAYEHHQPIAWTRTFRDGGRVYYNNMGHSDSTWDDSAFRTSIVNGIGWVGEVRPEQECLDRTGDVSTQHDPPAPDPTTVGQPCPPLSLPPRGGGLWEASGAPRVLTEDGDAVEVSAGLLGGLQWGAQMWVLDLSESGAATADVVLDLTWALPTDDYDLSVTTAWGFYGSDALVGATSEQVVLKDVPHCAVLDAAGNNMLATSGEPPTIAAAVTPLTAAAPAAAPATSTPAAARTGGDVTALARTDAVASTRALPATGVPGLGAALALVLVASAGLLRRTRGAL